MILDNEDFRLPRGRIAPADDIVTQLEASTFEFHLGGSYYFGCPRPDSDVDFITQFSENVVEWLESNGFTRMGGEDKEYLEPNEQTRGVYQNGKVQVQVVYDLKATLIARDILSTRFAEEHKDAVRAVRRAVWLSLINALGSVQYTFECGTDVDWI